MDTFDKYETLVLKAINFIRVEKRKRPGKREITEFLRNEDNFLDENFSTDLLHNMITKGFITYDNIKDSYYATANVSHVDSPTVKSNKQFINVEKIEDFIDTSVKKIMTPFIKKLNALIIDYESLLEEKYNLEHQNESMASRIERTDIDLTKMTNDVAFLKDEIRSKNEIIKILMENMNTCSYEEENSNQKYSKQKKDNDPKIPKKVTDIEKKKQNKQDTLKVEIIGDSMLNGLNDKGLNKFGNVKTRKYPGCTTKDLIHHAIPTIEKKPNVIICHSGTNDITNKVDTISNYQIIVNKIKKVSPHTKIVISSVITRKDKPNHDAKVTELNVKLKKFCDDNLVDYISHDNIEETCLSFKKLHLNKKGNAFLAKNFINYVNSI